MYFDGLLTEEFVKLAVETHDTKNYYDTEKAQRDINGAIAYALHGKAACAHGIDFCIWHLKKGCWVGACKEY